MYVTYFILTDNGGILGWLCNELDKNVIPMNPVVKAFNKFWVFKIKGAIFWFVYSVFMLMMSFAKSFIQQNYNNANLFTI